MISSEKKALAIAVVALLTVGIFAVLLTIKYFSL